MVLTEPLNLLTLESLKILFSLEFFLTRVGRNNLKKKQFFIRTTKIERMNGFVNTIGYFKNIMNCFTALCCFLFLKSLC